MECYICGTIVDKESHCPHCSANISAYRQILFTSENYYNHGLQLAQVRDLSGAIDNLKQALQFNKYNTKARNLLGLVYFELGETVLALSEWVISKNLDSDNELADKYLNAIQDTPGMLTKLNQTTKKYNQALIYCQQGSRDLASIQLRKVLNMNPKFVAGHQLLALLYMQEGKYNEARKELSAAGKIDVRNTTTLRYSKEVRERLKEQNQSKKKKKDDLIAFQDGNDTVVMPNVTFMDMLDASRASILNILVGLAIGLLICFFLVVPTVKQNATEKAAQSLVDTNEELSNSSTNVSQLKKKVNTLEKELEQYTGKADAVTSYEQLMSAKEAFDVNDLTRAAQEIETVNRELLSTKGQSLYDVIYEAAYNQILGDHFNNGNQLMAAQDYENAMAEFSAIVEINEDYNEGQALFNQGECQWKLSKRDDAIQSYKRVIELHSDSALATQARARLTEMGTSEDTPDGEQ